MLKEKEKDLEKVNEAKRPEKTKKIKSHKKIIFFLICIIILAIFSVIFAINVRRTNKIISGVSINGIDVSGKTKAEAKELFQEKLNKKKLEDLIVKLNAKTEDNEDYKGDISFEQLQINYKLDEALENAYKIGRENNLLFDNLNIIKTKLNKQNVDIEFEYNNEEFDKQVDTINGKIPGGVTESSYYIDNDSKELIITKGKEGIEIDPDILRENVEKEIKDVDNTEKEIELSTKTKQPNAIDLEKIYSEIHKEPKDAYYTKNPFTLYPHVDGVDFAVSMDEAKKILEQDREEYSIPLKITHPKITTDKIGSEAFPDLLAEYTTKYNAGNTSRTTNLKLASNKINNTVILPGETFSYNKVVGERTITAGYKEAAIYAGGKVVDGLGGGICQISSTLYNAVVFANLDIVSRSNHQFVPSYVTAGRDATVVYGAIDFKFKNTRNYPVKIKSSVSGGIAKVSIYGMKEDTEYQIKIETNITGSIPMKTTYEDDPTLEQGKEIVSQKGHNGTYSETYKIKYLNGKVVSRTLLSKDKYNAMENIIKRGTKTKQQNNNIEKVPDQTNINTPPSEVKPEEDTNNISQTNELNTKQE